MIARKNAKLIQVTPNTASFSTPYSSGDVVGSLNTIVGAALDSGACSNLISLVVTDAGNQKSDLDFLFFSDVLSVAQTDNGAYSLNDADLPLLMGRVSVAAAAYQSSSTVNAEATTKNIQLLLQAKAGIKNIYMLVVARAGPTYGSASDLIITLGLEQF